MTQITEATAVADMDQLQEKLSGVEDEVGKRIIGQGRVVNLTLTSLFAGGHAMLVGVPGLAKTLLVETLGTALGLDARRIQFTPDLMPSDIIGAEVLEETATGGRSFRFLKGPVFCQLLMADEINRASPRTQSALLQSMQERQVSVAGQVYDLPKPFHVLATRNPIEQEGAYPLPEAQLDRFLLEIDVTYPEREDERKVLLATTGVDLPNISARMTPTEVMQSQVFVRQMPVGDKVTEAILTLVRSCRPNDEDALPEAKEALAWGPGPRAGQALMLASRAHAMLDGRLSPDYADLAALAGPVLQHRMALNFAARAEGRQLSDIIAAAVEKACG